MKLIIDVDDMMDWTPAMNAASTIISQNPNQKINSSMSISQRGKTYRVTRNELSYTVET